MGEPPATLPYKCANIFSCFYKRSMLVVFLLTERSTKPRTQFIVPSSIPFFFSIIGAEKLEECQIRQWTSFVANIVILGPVVCLICRAEQYCNILPVKYDGIAEGASDCSVNTA